MLAVDDDADALGAVERELQDRYARHYRVVCLRSPTEARALLEDCAASGDDVALVLAAEQLGGTTGGELLDDVRHLHPHARRGLLIGWGDWGEKATGRAIFDGIAHGRFDHYVLRPSQSPDELFHQTISGTAARLGRGPAGRALHDPRRRRVVVGPGVRAARGAAAVRGPTQLLPRRLRRGSRSSSPRPATGASCRSWCSPTARCWRTRPTPRSRWPPAVPADLERMEFDVVIVGAGPAGLSAAVYGASEGLSTLVVDRGGIGGQATSSSLIRNYLGFPRGVSGRRLARAAYEQAWVFGADFAFMHTVTGLDRDGDQLLVTLSDGGRVRTSAVLLAMGASYRRIGVPSLEALNGAGVYYGGPTSEAPATGRPRRLHRRRRQLGRAGRAAPRPLRPAGHARDPGASLRAGMSEYLVRQVEATDNIEVRLGTEVVGGGGDGRLEHLVLRDARDAARGDGRGATALFLLIGAQPLTDWLPTEVERDEQGFVLTGADVPEGRAGRSIAAGSSSRRACRACSPPATSDTARSSGSRRRSARARSPSSCSTSSSPPRNAGRLLDQGTVAPRSADGAASLPGASSASRRRALTLPDRGGPPPTAARQNSQTSSATVAAPGSSSANA